MNKVLGVLTVGLATVCLSAGVMIGKNLWGGRESDQGKTPLVSGVSMDVVNITQLRAKSIEYNNRLVKVRAVVIDRTTEAAETQSLTIGDSMDQYEKSIFHDALPVGQDQPKVSEMSTRVVPCPVGWNIGDIGEFSGVYNATSNIITINSASKVGKAIR